MVSASTALSASQYMLMFFALGMGFFPELMGGYGMDFMSCPAASAARRSATPPR